MQDERRRLMDPVELELERLTASQAHASTSRVVVPVDAVEYSESPDQQNLVARDDNAVSIYQNQDQDQDLEPMPEEIAWEVNQVLDKQVNPVTGGIEYLIEWKEWSGPPTWEPENNCDCPSLIRKFEKERRRREASSQLASQRTPKRRGRQPGRKTNVLRSSSSTSPSSSQPLAITGPRTPQTRHSQSQSQSLRRSTRVQESAAKRVIDEITIDDTSSASNDNCDTNFDLFQPQTPTQIPRSKSPPATREPCCESSCSEAESDMDWYKERIKERKLKLKEIIGAVNGASDMVLIVKWHGIAKLEKVPLQVFRKFYCQELLDFFLNNLKWVS